MIAAQKDNQMASRCLHMHSPDWILVYVHVRHVARRPRLPVLIPKPPASAGCLLSAVAVVVAVVCTKSKPTKGNNTPGTWLVYHIELFVLTVKIYQPQRDTHGLNDCATVFLTSQSQLQLHRYAYQLYENHLSVHCDTIYASHDDKVTIAWYFATLMQWLRYYCRWKTIFGIAWLWTTTCLHVI